MGVYSLCERCSIRNCRDTPTKEKFGYKCIKRRVYRSSNSFLEVALENSPVDTMTLVHEHGLQITEGKKGFKISKRRLKT